MRYTMLLAIVTMVLLVTGCGNRPVNENDDPAQSPDVEQAGFVGYVVDKENNSIREAPNIILKRSGSRKRLPISRSDSEWKCGQTARSRRVIPRRDGWTEFP